MHLIKELDQALEENRSRQRIDISPSSVGTRMEKIKNR